MAGGINTYGYVGGNPLRYTDPYGLCFWDLCVIETAVAVEVLAWATLAVVAVAALYDISQQEGDDSDCGCENGGGVDPQIAGIYGSPGDPNGSGDDGDDVVVLGLERFGLERTAQQYGGRTLMNQTNWRTGVQNAISNPNTRIIVQLDGLEGNGTRTQIMNAAQRGAGFRPSPTNWEISQLYQAGRLPSCTFVRAGRIVSNPF